MHNSFAEAYSIPYGKLSADVVVLQTDAGVTQLKQGQHLPCGALVSSYQQGIDRKKSAMLCLCVHVRVHVCVLAQQIKSAHWNEVLLTWIFFFY